MDFSMFEVRSPASIETGVARVCTSPAAPTHLDDAAKSPKRTRFPFLASQVYVESAFHEKRRSRARVAAIFHFLGVRHGPGRPRSPKRAPDAPREPPGGPREAPGRPREAPGRPPGGPRGWLKTTLPRESGCNFALLGSAARHLYV